MGTGEGEEGGISGYTVGRGYVCPKIRVIGLGNLYLPRWEESIALVALCRESLRTLVSTTASHLRVD